MYAEALDPSWTPQIVEGLAVAGATVGTAVGVATAPISIPVALAAAAVMIAAGYVVGTVEGVLQQQQAREYTKQLAEEYVNENGADGYTDNGEPVLNGQVLYNTPTLGLDQNKVFVKPDFITWVSNRLQTSGIYTQGMSDFFELDVNPTGGEITNKYNFSEVLRSCPIYNELVNTYGQDATDTFENTLVQRCLELSGINLLETTLPLILYIQYQDYPNVLKHVAVFIFVDGLQSYLSATSTEIVNPIYFRGKDYNTLSIQNTRVYSFQCQMTPPSLTNNNIFGSYINTTAFSIGYLESNAEIDPAHVGGGYRVPSFNVTYEEVENTTGFIPTENSPSKGVIITPGVQTGVSSVDNWWNTNLTTDTGTVLYPMTIPGIGIGSAEALDTALDNVLELAPDAAQTGDIDKTVADEAEQETEKIQSAGVVLPNAPSVGALFTIYKTTATQLNQFASYLWSSTVVDTIKKWFTDPMDAIISLKAVPYQPRTSGANTIHIAGDDTHVPADVITSQYQQLNPGSIFVAPYFNSFLDYDPYTKIYAYIPFVGMQQIAASDVMGKTISLQYNVDVVTGDCAALLTVHGDGESKVLYNWGGNLSADLPVSGVSARGKIESALNAVTSGISAATGGGVQAVGSAVGSALSLFQTNVVRSGAITSSAGMIAGFIPYIIIERPIADIPDNYQTLHGAPQNTYTRIGSLSGFVQVDDIHLEGFAATEAEKTQIFTLLQEGVIL